MKKRVSNLFSVFILLGLIACSANKLTEKGIYKELQSKEYEVLLNRGNLNIIDVRTKGEYKKYHIKGAINASYFSGNFLDIVRSYNLDTNKVILIYCETQHRSPFAAKRLNKIGFKNIVDLKKGMSVWRKEGFPYESKNSENK